MAITFVGSHVGTHAATTAQTVNFTSLLNSSGGNTLPATGDIVFVAVENSSTVNRGAGALVPTGYTAAHTADYQNDSNDSNFQVSYKVMGATPDTTVDIPATNSGWGGVAYAIYVFQGVDTTTPQDVTTVVTGGINTGIANAAAITPVTAGAWIAVFGGAAVPVGAVFTNPAGMDTTTNYFRSATITSTSNDANIGGALYTGWTSGAYDPAEFGGSSSTNMGSWSAVTVALRPSSPDVTVALTGQSLTASGGSLAVTIAPALTGSALTASIGTVTVASSDVTVALTGLSLSAAQGSVAAANSKALTGQSLTAALGAITPANALGISGQASTLARGTIGPVTSRAITGQSGSIAQGSVTVSADVTVALTGQSLAAAAGSLTPATSKALTGQAITAAQGSTLAALSIGVSGLALAASQGSVVAFSNNITIALTGLSLSASQGLFSIPIAAAPYSRWANPFMQSFAA